MWLCFHKPARASGDKWTWFWKGHPVTSVAIRRHDEQINISTCCRPSRDASLQSSPAAQGQGSLAGTLWHQQQHSDQRFLSLMKCKYSNDGAGKEYVFNNSVMPSDVPVFKESFEYGRHWNPRWSRDISVWPSLPSMLQGDLNLSETHPGSVSDDTPSMASDRSQSTHSKHRFDLVLSKENKSECSRDFVLRADNLRPFTTARFYFRPQQWYSFALIPTESRQGVCRNRVVSRPGKREKLNHILIPATHKCYECGHIILQSV